MAKSRARKLADIIVGAGVDINGNLTFDGGSTSEDLTFADGDKAKFGDASDLQIYHDGSNSYITDSGTGNLRISGTLLQLNDASFNKYFLGSGSIVRLYYADSEKLQTTSSGVTVTGTTTSTGLAVNGSISGRGLVVSTSNETVTDNLVVFNSQHSSGRIAFQTGSTERARIDSSGNLGIGTTSPAANLHVKSASNVSTDPIFRIEAPIYPSLEFYSTNSNSNNRNWKISSVYNSYGTLEVLSSTSAGGAPTTTRLAINKDGNIGTVSSPQYPLDLRNPSDSNQIFRVLFPDSSTVQIGTSRMGSGNTQNVFLEGQAGVRFGVSGTEYARLHTNGYFGIGTTAPANRLHVKAGASGASTFDARYNLVLEDDGENYIGLYAPNNSFAGIRFVNGSSSLRGYIDYYHGSQGDKMHLYAQNSIQFDFPTTGTAAIIKQGGNVGIGTTSISSALSGSNKTLKIEDADGADIRLVHTGGIDFTLGVTNSNTAYIWNAGSHNILFGTAGTERMRLTSTGDVGIGTTSPVSKLHVQDGDLTILTPSGTGGRYLSLDNRHTGGRDYRLISTNDSHGSLGGGDFAILDYDISGNDAAKTRLLIDSSGNVGIGTTTPSQKLDVQGTILVNNEIQFINATTRIFRSSNDLRFRTGSSDRMTVTSAGNVGIGTTSPAEKLEVSGGHIRITDASGGSYFKAVQSTNGANAGYFMASGSSNWYTLVDTSGRYQIYDGDAAAIRVLVDGSGNVGIGTTVPSNYYSTFDNLVIGSSGSNGITVVSGTTGAGTVAFADGTSGDARYRGYVQYNHNGDKLALGSAGADRVTIDSSGNVGIGTSSPSANLEVENSSGATIMVDDTNGRFIKIRSANSGSQNANISSYSGLYLGGSDNASHMLISNSGNVGIGTTTPDEFGVGSAFTYLAVGGTKPGILNLVDDSTTGSYLQFGTAAGVRRASIHAVNGSHLAFTVNNSNSGTTLTEAMRIRNNGRVGIGTTAPANQFVIKSGTNVDMEFGSEASGAFIKTYNRSTPGYGYLRFITNGETMRLTNTGNVGIGDSDPDSKFVVNGGRASEGVTAGGTYTELTRTSGGDLGLLFNKDTSKWLIGIDNSDGNAGPLRFMYGAYNASVHPGFGTDYSGLNLAYNGYIGIGTKAPSTPLQIVYNGGHTSGTVGLANSAFDIYNPLEANTNEKGSILTFSDNYYASGSNTYHRTTRAAIKGGTDNAGNTADGFLAFYTDAAGANTMPERMRIDHDGSTVINSTSPFLIGGTARLSIYDSSVILSAGLSGSDMFYIRKQGTAAFAWQTYNGDNNGQIELQPYGGKVGIGTTSPNAKLHIDPGTDFSKPSLIINSPSNYSEGDLYVLHGRNVNTGIGFSSTAFGVNVQEEIPSDNIPQLRSNTGGLTSAGLMYVGADEVYQGVFGVMGATGSAGTDLSHLFTVRAGGQVGIGETIPDTNASVEIANAAPNTGVTTLRLTNAVNNKGQRIDFEDDNANRCFTLSHDNGSNITYMGSLVNESFSFYTNSLERFRLTADGYLLVGKTNTTFSNAGIELRPET